MKILVFPKDPNPYQELLYRQLRDKYNDEIDYLVGPTSSQTINLALLPLAIILMRLKGYQVFHLHWTYLFKIPKLDFGIVKLIMQYYCIMTMYLIKILGYKLVWTEHDFLPHDKQFVDDLAVNKVIAKLSDTIIVHTKHTVTQMKEAGVRTDNTVIIPVGSYGGIYTNKINKLVARKKLKINKDEFVFLFFGLIRQYKGVDDLINAFTELNIPKTRLVIAGECTDESLKKIIQGASKQKNIDFYDGFVPDHEVAAYLCACDVVCLPFKEVTTTSTALLGAAFSKPVVAPYIGTIRDMPKDIGYLYDPQKPDALDKALQDAFIQKNDLTKMGENARFYSEKFSWEKIAKKTQKVYEDVTGL